MHPRRRQRREPKPRQAAAQALVRGIDAVAAIARENLREHPEPPRAVRMQPSRPPTRPTPRLLDGKAVRAALLAPLLKGVAQEAPMVRAHRTLAPAIPVASLELPTSLTGPVALKVPVQGAKQNPASQRRPKSPQPPMPAPRSRHR